MKRAKNPKDSQGKFRSKIDLNNLLTIDRMIDIMIFI